MANPYPANFEGLDGSQRLTGQVDFTDSGNQPGGAAYTAPITRQQLTGNAVNIANGGTGTATWDHAFGPDVLLDRSTPALPAIIDAGVYVVTIGVTGAGLTVGGNFQTSLQLDFSNEDATITGTSALSQAGNTSVHLALTMAYYFAAGGTIKVETANEDGASARNFGLEATIQRVS